MSAGQPPKYSDPEELDSKVQDYLAEIKESGEPATITGLALYLGFCSRQSFYDYENLKEFSYTIKKARLTIESKYEIALHGGNASGPIFALKNLGWSDKQEIKQELTVSGAPTITFSDTTHKEE